MSSGHARADDAAGDAAASVAGGLRELVAASAEIIRVSVQHTRSAEHRVGAEKGDQLVLALILGDAIGAGLDVAEVTDVTLLVLRATMRSVVRVVVGTSRDAMLRQVAKLMNVEAMKARREALEISLDAALRVEVRLSEMNDALNR